MDSFAAATPLIDHVVLVLARTLLEPTETRRVPGPLNFGPVYKGVHSRPRSLRRLAVFGDLALGGFTAFDGFAPSSNWAWCSRCLAMILSMSWFVSKRGSRS